MGCCGSSLPEKDDRCSAFSGFKHVHVICGTVRMNCAYYNATFLCSLSLLLLLLLPVSRYPDLIFREKERLGRVFRVVTKNAGREEEILFPLSALTPPPPPGRSDLPSAWASALPELRVATAETAVVPELVSTGVLTPQQGAVVVDMIRAEDPVVFAACRVAGAAAATAGLALSTAAGRKGGGARRVGGGDSPGWSRDAKICLGSMLEIVLSGAHGVNDTGAGTAAGAGAREGRWCSARGVGFGGGDGCGEDDKGRGSREVPVWFQADAIALADVALVTGKVRQRPPPLGMIEFCTTGVSFARCGD